MKKFTQFINETNKDLYLFYVMNAKNQMKKKIYLYVINTIYFFAINVK